MANWDSIAEKWAEQWNRLRPWQVEERKAFATLVKNSLVLDLGCGHGRDTFFFSGLGLTCVGIDFSKGMLGLAKDKGILVRASVEYVPFMDGCFDALWSCSVMRYLSEEGIDRSMCEANRVLKQGGLFWLSLEYGSESRTEVKHDVGFTARLFDEKRIYSIASEKGFRVLETKIFREWRSFLTVLLEKTGHSRS